MLAIGAERQSRDKSLVTVQDLFQRPAVQVPKTDRPIPTPRSELIAIGADRDAEDPSRMPAEFALFGARGEVPEFDHLRPRQREPLAIGVDCQLVDPPTGSRKPKRLTAGRHVPDLEVSRVRARVAAVAR